MADRPKLICPLCFQVDQAEPSAPKRDEVVNEGATLGVPGNSVFYRYECPRCGVFDIDTFLLQAFRNGFDEPTGLRLSGLARMSPESPVVITRENWEAESARAPIPVNHAAVFDRILEAIADRARFPGRAIDLNLPEIAAIAFLPTDAVRAVVGQLGDAGLLSVTVPDGKRWRVSVRIDGWARVDELQRHRPSTNRAFVAMWFDRSMDTVYADGFHPALLQCGYEPPFRVDAPEHDARAGQLDYHRKIDDRILAMIRRSRFVVADATGARASVYYEAGFADGLAINVFWCCRQDRLKDDMAFDTRQIEHIVWKDPDDLRKQLVAKLERRGLRLID